MRWNLNEWLRIASNLAVLVGLALIYAEIQNNTHVTRALLVDSGYSQASDVYSDFVDAGMAEVWTKSITSPSELTMAERAQLNERLESLLILYTRERFFTNLDIYQEWEGIVRTTAGVFLENPYGQAYWSVRRESYNSEIVDAVDRVLAGFPATNVYADFDSAILRELERRYEQEQR